MPLRAYFKPWKELTKLPRPLWVLAGAMLVNRIGTMALPFFVLYLTKHLKLSASQAGFVFGVYGFVAFVVAPLTGKLCDRFNPVRIVLFSLTLSALFMALIPLVNGYGAVLALTIAWAAAGETFRPAALALRADLSPPGMQKQTQTLARLANNLGMSVGPALGGFIAHKSFPALFYVDALTSAAAALVFFLFFKAKPVQKCATAETVPSVGALRDKKFVYMMFSFVLVMCVFFQHESSMALFMVRDLKLPEYFFGLVFTINTLMIVLMEVPISHYTAHWSHRFTLSLGAALFAVAYGWLVFAKGAADIIANTVIWTFGEMILFPGLLAYVTELSPANRRGEYLGIYTMGISLGFVLGPWAGTVVFDKLGAQTLWLGTFVFGLIATLLFARIKPAKT